MANAPEWPLPVHATTWRAWGRDSEVATAKSPAGDPGTSVRTAQRIGPVPMRLSTTCRQQLLSLQQGKQKLTGQLKPAAGHPVLIYAFQQTLQQKLSCDTSLLGQLCKSA